MEIDKHEFLGKNIVGADPVNEEGEIPFYVMGNSSVTLTKCDIIALAKEIKLTSDDLW